MGSQRTPDFDRRRSVTIVAPVVARVGGMERAMTELAEGLLDRGRSLVVIALECELPPHPRLRIVRVTGPRRPASLAFPWFMIAASVALRRFEGELVHTQGAIVLNRADVVTAQFCHRAFRARVGTPRRQRDTPLHRINEWADAIMNIGAERAVYRPSRTRQIVTVARGVAAELSEYFPQMRGRIEVVPNGVDLELFGADPIIRREVRKELGLGDRRVALFVGGDWERKGLRYAITALEEAQEWSLLVVGDGDRRSFGALACSRRVGGRVRFLGRLSHPERIYAAADAFVFPTAYEAFSLVTLEAAAAGLPLLLTHGNGTEELLKDGTNGFFIEREAASIAAALRRLDDGTVSIEAMAIAARESARPYRWDHVADRYEELYQGLAAR